MRRWFLLKAVTSNIRTFDQYIIGDISIGCSAVSKIIPNSGSCFQNSTASLQLRQVKLIWQHQFWVSEQEHMPLFWKAKTFCHMRTHGNDFTLIQGAYSPNAKKVTNEFARPDCKSSFDMVKLLCRIMSIFARNFFTKGYPFVGYFITNKKLWLRIMRKGGTAHD